MQVLCSSPPTIIARCVHSAMGRRGPLPAPTACAHGSARSEAYLPSRFGPMPLHEKPLDSVDNSCTRAFPPATEDEYGIASNAVTVLRPDLGEFVALSTPNLLSHFHRKLDSGRPSLPTRYIIRRIRNHHRPIF